MVSVRWFGGSGRRISSPSFIRYDLGSFTSGVGAGLAQGGYLISTSLIAHVPHLGPLSFIHYVRPRGLRKVGS